jgi:hypothetical protein
MDSVGDVDPYAHGNLQVWLFTPELLAASEPEKKNLFQN